MPEWNALRGWMAFPFLDAGNPNLAHSYTIAYKITGLRFGVRDTWTDRCSQFKHAWPAAVKGCASLMRVAVPLLVGELKVNTSKAVFIPAIRSGQTVAPNDGALSNIARACAEAVGAEFVCNLVTKDSHESLHETRKNARERREVLNAANYRAESVDADTIFVFDDFITTGQTLSHTAQAIRTANRGVNVYGIGLGKAENWRYNKEQRGQEVSNRHVPREWDSLWSQGEKER